MYQKRYTKINFTKQIISVIIIKNISGYIMNDHYVKNSELFDALVEYKKQVREANETGANKPPIPNYIGECILKIATRITRSANFVGSRNRSVYISRETFNMHREEMIGDAVENCLRYLHNFDPEKSQNPFAYFTQIIVHSFIRRIIKEKKQLMIKNRIIMDSYFDVFDVQEHDQDSQYENSYIKFLQDNVVESPIKSKVKVKQKEKLTISSSFNDIFE